MSTQLDSRNEQQIKDATVTGRVNLKVFVTTDGKYHYESYIKGRYKLNFLAREVQISGNQVRWQYTVSDDSGFIVLQIASRELMATIGMGNVLQIKNG